MSAGKPSPGGTTFFGGDGGSASGSVDARAYYLFGAALNAFFPLYVVALVLSAGILILALSNLDAGRVSASFRPKTPVRIIGGYLAFIGIGLACVWTAMWAAYVFAGRPTPVDPEAFKPIAAGSADSCCGAGAPGDTSSLRWRASRARCTCLS